MSRNERYIAFTRALDDLYIYPDLLDVTGFEKKPRKKKDNEQESTTEAQGSETEGSEQIAESTGNSKDKPKHGVEKVEKNHSKSAVREFFESNGLELIDNRDRGGRLWVVGEKVAIKNVINAAIAKFGISGKYAIGKEIKNKNGWCTKTGK